jgi:hypothetical protein
MTRHVLKAGQRKQRGEFRLIRGLDESVNFHRFVKYVERLKRTPALRETACATRIKRRFTTRQRWAHARMGRPGLQTTTSANGGR